MTRIIMNEPAYIDELRKNGNLGENVKYAVSLLARSYYAERYDTKAIKGKLEEDLCRYEPDLKAKQREIYIANALRSAKNSLVNVDEILITKSEMDLIMNMISDNKAFRTSSLRRLAFTLLCFTKFEIAKGKEHFWINYDLSRIYKAAKLTGRSCSQNNLYMHELYKKGMVEFAPRKNSIGVKVNFAGMDDNEEIAVRVKDINYAGDYFLQYNGRKYIECKVCGKLVPKTNGKLLYCRDCAIIARREQQRKEKAKLREKDSNAASMSSNAN